MNSERLLDEVRRSYEYQARKHDLCEVGETPAEYADRQIDALTNAELVYAIGEAFEQLGKRMASGENTC